MADSDTRAISHFWGEWQRAFATLMSYSVSGYAIKAIGLAHLQLLRGPCGGYFDDSAWVVGVRSRCEP